VGPLETSTLTSMNSSDEPRLVETSTFSKKPSALMRLREVSRLVCENSSPSEILHLAADDLLSRVLELPRMLMRSK